MPMQVLWLLAVSALEAETRDQVLLCRWLHRASLDVALALAAWSSPARIQSACILQGLLAVDFFSRDRRL